MHGRRMERKTRSDENWRRRAGNGSWISLVAALVLLGVGLSIWAADYGRGRPTARPVVRRPTAGETSALSASPASGPHATKPIEQIRVGDRVVAQDPLTGETQIKRVLRVFKRRSRHIRRLCIRSARGLGKQWIETTDEHPFWVPRRGWVPAGRLVAGDQLRQADGQTATLIDVDFLQTPAGVHVYNIETEDLHTYCVAANDRSSPILVHNCNLGSVEKFYHYTNVPLDAVLARGLRPGKSGKVFLTPNASLTPLQAHLGLALPPNRGLPQHLLEIDVKTLRDLGIEISELRQVGRRFNLPGGELESTVSGSIPPAAIRPVR